MPPKITFSKNDVLEAAYKIVEKFSISKLTARSIAKELGSSTAPVYSHYQTMEELERDVIRKAKDQLIEFTQKEYTNFLFLNIGIGIAVFAREHSSLYRSIFMEGTDFKEIISEFNNSIVLAMDSDPFFADVLLDTRTNILNKLSIFTHGLSAMICVGFCKDSSNRFIIKTLSEMGSIVITEALNPIEKNKIIFDDNGGAYFEC